MHVHIGSDHAGFDLKAELVRTLTADGHDVVDHGPAELDPDDDYPIYCIPVAEGVAAEPGSLGVVIGGSGNGEQIAANKVIGVRAVLAYDNETAKLGRRHNDATVIAVGARMHTVEQATEIVRTFLDTDFSGEQRHQRRIDQLDSYEKERRLRG